MDLCSPKWSDIANMTDSKTPISLPNRHCAGSPILLSIFVTEQSPIPIKNLLSWIFLLPFFNLLVSNLSKII